MKKLAIVSAMLASSAGIARANDITQGGATPSVVENCLFVDTAGVISNVNVTITSFTGSLGPCLPGDDVQVGIAGGFRGANGIAISNAPLEQFDNDGAATAPTAGCGLTADGSLGLPGGLCEGLDPQLAMALQAAFGGAVQGTQEAAIVEVTFDVSATTNLDISYQFLTMELPGDAFFDSFGIILDGALVAGGNSAVGAAPATDPWTLAPTAAGEYQSVPASGFHILPANSTGLRTITQTLAPGSHTLSFHVADSGPVVTCMPVPGACDIVNSTLVFGVHTYEGSAPICGAGQIGRVGHPSPSFSDYAVTLTGAAPSQPAFLVGSRQAAEFTFGLLSPCQALIDVTHPSFQFLSVVGGATDGTGATMHGPLTPPASLVGLEYHYQWWWVNSAGTAFENSKGMLVKFGS